MNSFSACTPFGQYPDDYDGELGWNPFKAVGKLIGGAAKGVAKVVGKVAKPAIGIASQFIPGGGIIRTGVDILTSQFAPGGTQPVLKQAPSAIATQLPRAAILLMNRIRAQQGKQLLPVPPAVTTPAAELPPVQFPTQLPPSVPAPGAPPPYYPPGAAPTAGALPPWLLPAGIAALAAVLLLRPGRAAA